MKTLIYNPSPLEKEFALIIQDLRAEIQKKIKHTISDVENNLNADNPCVIFKLTDEDGDKHELVIKIIQRVDE